MDKICLGKGALLILCLASQAHAATGEIWISPYSHTQHYRYDAYIENGEMRKFQDSHPSLGIEYEDSRNTSMAAGVYRDSYGGRSIFLARHRRFNQFVGITSGVLLGEKYPFGFLPFMGPELVFQAGGLKVSAAYLPGFGISTAPNLGVVQVSVKIF